MVGIEIIQNILCYDIRLDVIRRFDGGYCFWTCRLTCVPALEVQPLLLDQAKDVVEILYPVRTVVEDLQLMENVLPVVCLALF